MVSSTAKVNAEGSEPNTVTYARMKGRQEVVTSSWRSSNEDGTNSVLRGIWMCEAGLASAEGWKDQKPFHFCSIAAKVN